MPYCCDWRNPRISVFIATNLVNDIYDVLNCQVREVKPLYCRQILILYVVVPLSDNSVVEEIVKYILLMKLAIIAPDFSNKNENFAKLVNMLMSSSLEILSLSDFKKTFIVFMRVIKYIDPTCLFSFFLKDLFFVSKIFVRINTLTVFLNILCHSPLWLSFQSYRLRLKIDLSWLLSHEVVSFKVKFLLECFLFQIWNEVISIFY